MSTASTASSSRVPHLLHNGQVVTRFPHAFVDLEHFDFCFVRSNESAQPRWHNTRLQNTTQMLISTLSRLIRNKPQWYNKIHDPTIVSKWRHELRHIVRTDFHSRGGCQRLDEVADQVVHYVLQEITQCEKVRMRFGFMERAPVDAVWWSDRLLSCQERHLFRHAFDKLEITAEAEGKDWHPGSNKQVWNLVHPSSYPLIVGVSRILNNNPTSSSQTSTPASQLSSMGRGELLTQFETPSLDDRSDIGEQFRSAKFQWLPADVLTSSHKKSVRFLSYINNLHPITHSSLYHALETVIAKFIPLFERVLTDLLHPPVRQNVNMDMDDMDEMGGVDSGSDASDASARWHESVNLRQPIVEVGEFVPFGGDVVGEEETVSLWGRRLQIIVKLANTELEANEMFQGGVWHVEGCDNERIVATGIYYHQVDNITTSSLSFRQAVESICGYEQDDAPGVFKMYGLNDHDPLCQPVGAIDAKEGRCIAFPNVYQHKVSAFGTLDGSKGKGVRKILVLFLVDPTQEVLSTMRVPPQRKDWLVKQVATSPSASQARSWVDQVETEILEKIVDELDFPIARDAAETLRDELMEERKFVVDRNSREVFQREFSLCEH